MVLISDGHGGDEGVRLGDSVLGLCAFRLDLLWRAYCRRFSVEHAIRFLKERLGWVRPKVRHPEQADRWTWLILAAYAQLLLARGVVADHKLPWEKPLTMGEVVRGR